MTAAPYLRTYTATSLKPHATGRANDLNGFRTLRHQHWPFSCYQKYALLCRDTSFPFSRYSSMGHSLPHYLQSLRPFQWFQPARLGPKPTTHVPFAVAVCFFLYFFTALHKTPLTTPHREAKNDPPELSRTLRRLRCQDIVPR